jgi:hypothetical protein
MISVLSSLRLVVSSLSEWDAGMFVRQFIEKDILPQLKRQPDKFVGLIQEYESYLEQPNGNVFGRILKENIWREVRRYKATDLAEDFEQNVLIEFMNGSGRKNLFGVLSKFNIMDGPRRLSLFWSKVTIWRIAEMMRTYKRHHQEETIEVPDRPAPEEVDLAFADNMLAELRQHMKGKLAPKQMEMFDLWLELAQENGVRNVDFKWSISPYLKKYDVPYPTVMSWWSQKIKPAIIDFFMRKLDVTSGMVREYIGSDVVTSVSYAAWRAQTARWILNMRGNECQLTTTTARTVT